ncbi:hypothetical protein ACJQWK_11180 [Exserohilum turcicum]
MPICRRCTKSSRECSENSKSVFRHQHNASITIESSSKKAMTRSFYAYKDTFKHDAVWLKIPSRLVTFIHTSNPYLENPSPGLDTASNTSIYQTALCERPPDASLRTSFNSHPITISPTSTNSVQDSLSVPVGSVYRAGVFLSCMQPLPPSSQETSSAPLLSLCGPSARDHEYQTPAPPLRLDVGIMSLRGHSPDFIPHPSTVWSSGEQPTYSYGDSSTKNDSETGFLLRQFSEGPGRWMDVFDSGAYFSAYVPVQARHSKLLEHAAVACAAKVLARIELHKPVTAGSTPHCTGTKPHHSIRSVEWKRKAAEHYGAAISLLRECLDNKAIIALDESDCVPRDDSNNVEEMSKNQVSGGQSVLSKGRLRLYPTHVVAASTILSMYELLDASTSEWVEHLKGAQFLLAPQDEPMTSLQMPGVALSKSPERWGFSCDARRATFWNIVRQDVLAAYINQTRTRIDTENFIMWKQAGLPIDDQGFLNNSESGNCTSLGFGGTSRESLLCNSLTWLMARLANFLASLNQLPLEANVARSGMFNETPSKSWWSLQRQFQVWHESLPVTFRPSTTGSDLFHTLGPQSVADPKPTISEAWCSTPLCASAEQLYHMSQILLHNCGRHIMNAQPKACHAICAVCKMHSRKIIGISLAHVDGAVRINSVQPLFVAGLCLDELIERRVLINLLRRIEKDFGWSTEARVYQMLQQWQ